MAYNLERKIRIKEKSEIKKPKPKTQPTSQPRRKRFEDDRDDLWARTKLNGKIPRKNDLLFGFAPFNDKYYIGDEKFTEGPNMNGKNRPMVVLGMKNGNVYCANITTMKVEQFEDSERARKFGKFRYIIQDMDQARLNGGRGPHSNGKCAIQYDTVTIIPASELADYEYKGQLSQRDIKAFNEGYEEYFDNENTIPQDRDHRFNLIDPRTLSNGRPELKIIFKLPNINKESQKEMLKKAQQEITKPRNTQKSNNKEFNGLEV